MMMKMKVSTDPIRTSIFSLHFVEGCILGDGSQDRSAFPFFSIVAGVCLSSVVENLNDMDRRLSAARQIGSVFFRLCGSRQAVPLSPTLHICISAAIMPFW